MSSYILIVVIEYKHGLCLNQAPDLDESLFVGRSTELEKIQDILHKSQATSTRVTAVLGGMGGIGKTQLAITYAKRSQGQYSSVFWLNASSKITLQASLQSVAQVVGIYNKEMSEETITTKILTWFSAHDNNCWLLIYDNYDDVEEYNITEYYPPRSWGSIIVTTRSPDMVNGSPIEVKALQIEHDGLKILEKRSGRQLGHGREGKIVSQKNSLNWTQTSMLDSWPIG
jgi:hypothetical protein